MLSVGDETGASHVALVVRTHLPMQERKEMPVQSLGQEDPLEEGMTTHSSIFAWHFVSYKGFFINRNFTMTLCINS